MDGGVSAMKRTDYAIGVFALIIGVSATAVRAAAVAD
jgi:hypothetical protein